MVYYRLYQLRGSKNHVASFREFHADGDSVAILFAESWRGFNPMELWCGDRKVRRWEALEEICGPVQGDPLAANGGQRDF